MSGVPSVGMMARLVTRHRQLQDLGTELHADPMAQLFDPLRDFRQLEPAVVREAR
jgi:hypothetical protein